MVTAGAYWNDVRLSARKAINSDESYNSVGRLAEEQEAGVKAIAPCRQ
jgi:hypothetical protein